MFILLIKVLVVSCTRGSLTHESDGAVLGIWMVGNITEAHTQHSVLARLVIGLSG